MVIEKDVDLVKEQLQYAVKQLVDWSRENDMVLNASKSKVMIFGNTCCCCCPLILPIRRKVAP